MSQHFVWSYFPRLIGQNCGTTHVDVSRINYDPKLVQVDMALWVRTKGLC